MPPRPPNVPKVRISTLSPGENRAIQQVVGVVARAAAKKDFGKFRKPPTLRMSACSARFNRAFNTAYKAELTAAFDEQGAELIPAAIAAGIIGNIIGNIAGNIISQKIS